MKICKIIHLKEINAGKNKVYNRNTKPENIRPTKPQLKEDSGYTTTKLPLNNWGCLAEYRIHGLVLYNIRLH
jgi:hypothetical protein